MRLRRLVSPLARFLRHCWMGVSRLWSWREEGGRPSSPRLVRRARPALEAMEAREAPIDVLGLLLDGAVAAQVALAEPEPLPAIVAADAQPVPVTAPSDDTAPPVAEPIVVQ
ncbi:MAG: hypothetical protein K2W96_00325 [Gemmataceae bacterium]|nr:hypothetical protein [Gemmataceae bacterium]